MRVPQTGSGRGSLKWIQRLVQAPESVLRSGLEDAAALPLSPLTWKSPLPDDDWAEYRDGDFLERIGHPELTDALSEFWPSRGPQWDGLGVFGDGTVLLVEAKANIPELNSVCGASADSLARIRAALRKTADGIGATFTKAWLDEYYQYANRLAHLCFLQEAGIPARLLFVYFTGDTDVGGPANLSAWKSALDEMYGSLAIGSNTESVVPAFIPVSQLVN